MTIVTKVSVCARIIAKLEKSFVVNVKIIVDISNSLANKLFQMFLSMYIIISKSTLEFRIQE